MNTPITSDRDARNKKLIANSFNVAFGLGLNSKQRWLLRDGTPEERDAYVKKQTKYFFICGAMICVVFAVNSMIPKDQLPPPPAPEITSAGQVQSLQLHETALSTSTTVITAIGNYQVRGGVSAATGDVVTLKRETDHFHKTSLCVESKIKTECYSLL